MRLSLSGFAWVLVSYRPARSFVVAPMSSTSPARWMSSRDEELSLFHLQRTVDSTQEEAKRLLEEHPGWLAVIADHQSKGRGTSGRPWVATQGNLFLTCTIPMEMIPLQKLTLLPLGVGLVVAETLQRYSVCRPTVKWPNDVLVDSKKIAGTLIENYRVGGQQDFWIVGIGVNVQTFPVSLPSDSRDFRVTPRSATSLQEYAKPDQTLPSVVSLGTEMANRLRNWTQTLDQMDAIDFITKWKAWSDMGATYEIRETGETVRILDVQPDGQLLVQDEKGDQRVLVADYFF